MDSLTEFSEASTEKLPNRPGIYLFYDKDKKLLYAGKAANLKGRIGRHLEDHGQAVLGFECPVIDLVLYWVKYFMVQLVPREEIREQEKRLISQFHPPLNHESKSEIYFKIQVKYAKYAHTSLASTLYERGPSAV